MELLALLEELRAMARTGLNHADDPYDAERYERMLELVDHYYGAALDVPPADVRDRLVAELGQVTPKVGAEAVIVDEDRRLLLMQRADTGTWCLPGGAVKVTESPAEAAARETEEETGLVVEPIELVDAYYRPPTQRFPWSAVLLPYVCEPTGGELRLSHEGLSLRYWHVSDVPDWFLNHERMALDALERMDEGP